MSNYSPYLHDDAVIQAVNLLGQAKTSHIDRLVFHHNSPASQGRQCRRTLRRLYNMGEISCLPAVVSTHSPIWIPARSTASRIEPHDLAVTELYCQVREAERRGELTMLNDSELDEIIGKTIDGTQKRSDMYLWYEVAGQKKDRFIEIDRGSERGPQIKAKFRVYSDAYKRSTVNFPAVLWVVDYAPNNKLAERVKALQRVAAREPKPQLFTICTLDEALDLLIGRHRG